MTLTAAVGPGSRVAVKMLELLELGGATNPEKSAGFSHLAREGVAHKKAAKQQKRSAA